MPQSNYRKILLRQDLKAVRNLRQLSRPQEAREKPWRKLQGADFEPACQRAYDRKGDYRTGKGQRAEHHRCYSPTHRRRHHFGKRLKAEIERVISHF